MDGRQIDSRAMAATRNQTRHDKEIVHGQLFIETSFIEQQKEIDGWMGDKYIDNRAIKTRKQTRDNNRQCLDKEIVLGQLSIETDEREQQLKIDKYMVDRLIVE